MSSDYIVAIDAGNGYTNGIWAKGRSYKSIGFPSVRASVTGDYTLISGASQINIQAAVNKFSERYADWVSNNIIDGVFNGLRGIKSLILVGGGATLTAGHMAKYYPDKLLSVSKHKHVAKISPTELNAVGGIRLALARQKA